MRALATRELSSGNTRRIIRRELLVGLLNGLAFAVILGVVAGAGSGSMSTQLGLVIALAMVTVLAAAALAAS